MNFIVLIANSDSTLLKINQQLSAFENNKKDIQFFNNVNQYNFQLLKFKPEKCLDISNKIIQNSKISGLKTINAELLKAEEESNKFKKDLEKLNEELSLMVAKRNNEIEKLYSDQKTYIFHHNHQLRRPLTNILEICEVFKKLNNCK